MTPDPAAVLVLEQRIERAELDRLLIQALTFALVGAGEPL